MSWLRNLQGQLTDLANEVLSEATEEVADPESELQVAVKKAADAERELASERGKNDLLEKRCNDLQQTLLDYQTEMEMERAKFESMISGRDHDLKKLRIEIEQFRSHNEEVELGTPKSGESEIFARDKAVNLLSNIHHQLETLRAQKDDEIAVIMEQHSRTLQELRETYEEKLRNIEASFPASTSQSGISIIGSTTVEHPDLSAVHDELESLALTQSGELQSDVNKREEEMHKLQITIQELTDANLNLSTRVDELSTQLAGNESLNRQITELTRAYNDLNTEYDSYKENNGGAVVRNQDLVQRIDTLRANLIEYEERYEQCRREHGETERQLLQLTEQFDNLKDAMDKAPVEEEFRKMKEALSISKNEGTLLKSEIECFRNNVVLFQDELEELRVMNRKLIDENEKLCNSIRDIQHEPIEEQYEKIIDNFKQEKEALNKKNSILEEKIKLMAQYQILTRDNESGEKEQLARLLEKNRLLEEVNSTSKERIMELESQQDCEGRTFESITQQLREALASGSETTEECEKLRAELEETKKEVTVRQSCVDDLIVQNNLLQVQYQEAIEQLQKQIPLSEEKDKSILKLEQDLAHTAEGRDIAVLKLEQLKDQACASGSKDIPELVKKYKEELHDAREQHRIEVESLQNDFTASVKRIQELQEELKKLQGLQEYSNQMQAHNEDLRKIVSDKHDESLKYFTELQNVVAQLVEKDNILHGMSIKLAEFDENLNKERSAKEALQKDLARLKVHLIDMEKSTTAEAIDAEKREMDLRARVEHLEKTHHSATAGASEQSRVLELRVDDLTLRLDEAERSSNYWKSQAEVTEKLRQETADALQSLQGVLREISTDHEKESAKLKHSNGELLIKLSNLTKELTELKGELERLKFDKQAVEDEVEAVQREIVSRQRIIDELENQMEDLKSAAHKDNSSYRIDDATLRGLFMSYFTASNDKKADIALLLANILQYPKEDVDKIAASLFPNGKSTAKPRSAGGASLTEQFVRFLESESESSKTAPQLPVDRQTLVLAADLPSSVRVPPSSLDEILK